MLCRAHGLVCGLRVCECVLCVADHPSQGMYGHTNDMACEIVSSSAHLVSSCLVFTCSLVDFHPQHRHVLVASPCSGHGFKVGFHVLYTSEPMNAHERMNE